MLLLLLLFSFAYHDLPPHPLDFYILIIWAYTICQHILNQNILFIPSALCIAILSMRNNHVWADDFIYLRCFASHDNFQPTLYINFGVRHHEAIQDLMWSMSVCKWAIIISMFDLGLVKVPLNGKRMSHLPCASKRSTPRTRW